MGRRDTSYRGIRLYPKHGPPLAVWMDLGLQGNEFIEVDELEPFKQRIGEFLLRHYPVTIDGEPAQPILDRSSYVKVALTGIQLLEKPERLEISTAIIGVILTYLTDGIPREVKVDWELFTDQVKQIPATATDPAGPLPGFVTPDDNVLTCSNYLRQYELPTVDRVGVQERAGLWHQRPFSTLGTQRGAGRESVGIVATGRSAKQ